MCFIHSFDAVDQLFNFAFVTLRTFLIARKENWLRVGSFLPSLALHKCVRVDVLLMENAALSRGECGRTGVTKEIITCTRAVSVLR